jgi:hypothetical protein
VNGRFPAALACFQAAPATPGLTITTSSCAGWCMAALQLRLVTLSQHLPRPLDMFPNFMRSTVTQCEGGARVTPFSRLSPNEITNYDPIQLGTGGFCFLVAELLKANYPQTELRRLTNREGKTYPHVFVRIDGMPCDINGFRSVDAMRFDLDDNSLVEQIADAQAIRDYFYPVYSPEQLAAARSRLAPYVGELAVAFRAGRLNLNNQQPATNASVKQRVCEVKGLPAD